MSERGAGGMVHNSKELKMQLRRQENYCNKTEVNAFQDYDYLSNVSQNRKKTGLSR